LFAKFLDTPAAQALLASVGKGGVLTCSGISQAAQPFVATLLRLHFPQRPIVVVTDQLRTQEMFQQDIATWMQVGAAGLSPSMKHGPPTAAEPPLTHNPVAPNSSLFFPGWEVLPHDERLPHVDVIGDRLETLVALTRTSGEADSPSPLVITSVTALLQRTFPRNTFDARLRTVRRGDQVEPLDLVEWLEEQGYEPEAQVSHKGEIALRGGILDLFPLTSPWPVRLEFFGNEIESLRYFDQLTQI